jgi:hypothetical protein
MIYMAATKKLYCYAKHNVDQILDKCASASAPNVIVQLDHRDEKKSVWYYRGAEGEQIEPHDPPMKGEEDVDGGPVAHEKHSRRLEAFYHWSVAHFPSERYFLVLWGHGDGLDRHYILKKPPSYLPQVIHVPRENQREDDLRTQILRTTGVLGSDDGAGYLSNVQLGILLNKFKQREKKLVDLLGFDACLMGMAEIFQEISDSVSYVVASSDEIPYEGWPYDSILDDLARDPNMSSTELAKVIVRRYGENYCVDTNKSRSIAACNLNNSCHELAVSMRHLVHLLKAGVSDSALRDRIWTARNKAQCYDEKSYIDLHIFCKELEDSPLSDEVSQAGRNVTNILNRQEAPYVVCQDHSKLSEKVNSKGVSVYFPVASPRIATVPSDTQSDEISPPNGKSKIVDYEVIWGAYQNLQFCRTTGWADFLQELFHQGV